MVQPVKRVRRVILVLKEKLDLKVILEQQAKRVSEEILGKQVQLVIQATRV
jgi:hypothetical protein